MLSVAQAMGTPRARGMADRILDIAERLVQVRGYNAFSYADVAKAVGVQKASLHHHFSTKADMGATLVERYHRAFFEALAGVDASAGDAKERLEGYIGLYASVVRRKRMCLCGMLASDVATLPKGMRDRLATFFQENEAWLANVLADGTARGTLRFEGEAATVAAFFVSSLEGAMLVARGSDNPRHFDRVAQQLLATVHAGPAWKRARPVRARS